MGWLQTKHPNYFVLTLSCPQHLMSQVGLRLTRFVLDVALIYITVLFKKFPCKYLFRQLEPDNDTGLMLDEAQSSFDVELWEGEKVRKSNRSRLKRP